MTAGWVKLWRKSLDAGWLKNPKLWNFWSYSLLKATHKSCTVIIGCQQVQLSPGQFIFGRKKVAEETGLSQQEVRTCKAFLEKAENITSKSTNKFSIITIVKWGFYQSESDRSTNRSTNEQPTTNHIQECKEDKEEKKRLFVLLEKYTGEEKTLIEQTLQAIATTRKTGKLSEGKKVSILQQFEKHDLQQVLTSCKTYLDKEYHRQCKNEKYLFGIIQNTATQAQSTEPALKLTGSKMLDDFYHKKEAEATQ
jgi:hypothetical protein